MSDQRITSDYWAFDDSIGYLARLIFRSFSSLREQRTRACGISSGQWTFLRQLWREDGISQRELSRRVAMRDATTAVTVRTFERAGLVRREVNRRDQREILVHLTPRGRSLKARLMPVTAEIQALATRGLSDAEVDALEQFMRRVIGNLAAADGDFGTARAGPRPAVMMKDRSAVTGAPVKQLVRKKNGGRTRART